jgi:hypothetical protein
MSHSPYAIQDAEEKAPFAGHPFGGLPREDRLGVLATFDNQSADRQPQADTEWTAGFDFHLGVYSRF